MTRRSRIGKAAALMLCMGVLLSGCTQTPVINPVPSVNASAPAETLSPSPVSLPSSQPTPSPTPSASADAYEVSLVETDSLAESKFETASDISKELASVEKSMNFKLKGDDSVTQHKCTLSDECLENLKEQMSALSLKGYHYGFFLEDLKSRKAIAYNADEDFYCASSIKAFYVASLLDWKPSTYDTDRTMMINAVMNSDNDAYAYLRSTYWRDPIRRWCSIAGVDMQIPEEMYPSYSAREVAKLWAVNWWWFDNDEEGKLAASWYESPNVSEIRKLVPESVVTRTKAGWIVYSDETEYLIATNEGGIIYEGEHPFILAVMSDAPSDFSMIEGIISALLMCHEEMIPEGERMLGEAAETTAQAEMN